MKLSKFKFNLPQELIALHPAKNRDVLTAPASGVPMVCSL